MIASAIKILTNPLFSLITLLLGFLIGNRLVIGRDRRKEFIAASDEFRKTFTQALVDTYDENIFFDVYSVDKENFKKLQIAYLSFRHYLKGINLRHYDEAWENYRYDCKEHWDFHSSVREAVAEDIKHLLEFTECKLSRSMAFVCGRIWWKIRFKLFGPDKETKELLEKFSKHDEPPEK